MRKPVGYFLIGTACLAIGYFAGREHMKYEIRSAFQSTAKEAQLKADYIANFMDLYDFTAKYYGTPLHGNIPGARFTLKNRGDRDLSEVKVTVYFNDAEGNTISEKDYYPVSVSRHPDDKPLKADKVWQMQSWEFYQAKTVPSEWQEGNAKAVITEINFAD